MTNGQIKLSKPAATASFEEYLKYYARRKDWSQSRLAVCARLNQSHINKIINGNVYNISVDVLTCISLALQLTLEESKDLLARTERAFSPASDQHQAYQELIAIYASPEYTFEEGNNMLSFADDYLEKRKLARLPNVEDY